VYVLKVLNIVRGVLQKRIKTEFPLIFLHSHIQP